MSLKLDVGSKVQRAKARLMSRPGGWLQMFGEGGDTEKGGFSREYVEDLRKESAEYRTKLRAAETERDQYKTQAEEAKAKITEAQKGSDDTMTELRTLLKLDAKADLTAVKAKVTEALEAPGKLSEKATQALIKSAFATAANGKVVNVDAAFKLANLANVKGDLETLTAYTVDEKGIRVKGKDNKEVNGLDSVVEGLLTEHAYLRSGQQQRQPAQPGGGGSNPGPETNQTQPKGTGLLGALGKHFGVGGNASS